VLALPPFSVVEHHRVRHLRDARAAFPAMLAAVAGARREVLLEMYWVGDDAAGVLFRDALVSCARRGVAVRVVYDAVGSLGLWPSWWAPLREAGGEILVYAPVAPWRRRFSITHVLFRDHRKLLVVDGDIAFAGGINLARPWLDVDEGGLGWRDDTIEVRGPAAREVRRVFSLAWEESSGNSLEARAPVDDAGDPPTSQRVSVLANRVGTRPNRLIRRAYLRAIQRAERTIDIACSYFLPGPFFLLALRAACARGVQVRIIIPRSGDVWLAALATSNLVDRLVSDGIEVYRYGPAMLHAKTAILDRRVVTIGSHNLDTLSWRYNLECNVAVDDVAFASIVTASFERDVASSERIDLAAWRTRRLTTRIAGWIAARFRMFL
jgi:cardiolipin synthase